MNIFHKLDIHYPGTDIRAEAQGSWLGEGAALACFPTAPLQPRVTGLQRKSSLPTVPAVAGWGYLSPIFPLPMSSSPLTLKLLLLPGSRLSCQPGRCVEGGGMPELWGMQGPAQGTGEV